MTSYYALLNKLETFFNAHLQVKKFGGEFREQMPNFSTMDERYPLVYVVPTSELSGMNTNVFTLEVYCVDIIQKDRANINTILSDCQLILNDLYLYYTDGSDLSVTVITDPTMTPLNNFDLDYVAGWVGTFTFEVDQYSVCAIPLEPITPVTNECLPASYLVEYENGTDIQEGEIPSGGSLTIVVPDPIECDPATVNLVNTDLTLLLTESVDCGTTEQIIAPDATVHLRKSNNGTIHVEAIPSGVTENYIVADNNITVNQVNPFTIHATDPLNIRLHNQQGGDIVPQSVVYQGNSNHVTITVNTSSFVPVGATLQKTGQTVSYNQNDDGDTERGRLTNFLTLPSNNPFGNTNRFTNKTGGQVYTNSVAFDWSTYNGSTVLAYYFGDANTRAWATQLNQYKNSDIDGLRGWDLFNIYEAMNIMNFSFPGGYLYNYAPFNLTRRYMFVSTNQAGTGAISTETGGPNPFASTNKSNSLWGIWVRVCTVTGTNIT
jgi:hypothetical protein